MQQTLGILRLPQVKALTGLSRSSIYAAVKAGSFPKPFRLGPRAVGFSAGAVEAWVGARMAGRPETEVRALVQNLNLKEAM